MLLCWHHKHITWTYVVETATCTAYWVDFECHGFCISCHGFPINLLYFSYLLHVRCMCPYCFKSGVLIFIGMLPRLLTGHRGTAWEPSFCLLWEVLCGDFDMDMSYTRVLHTKSRVPRTSQMTSRLLRRTAAAMRAHNVFCNRYSVTVITHGRCYARA
jgi:hypothetical protein